MSPEKYLAATVDVPSPVPDCVNGVQGGVFAKDPEQLPAVSRNDDKAAWAAANGGIPASGNYVVATLQGLNLNAPIRW